jgi:spermidine synthase
LIPWVRLDTANIPDGGGELRLMQRGAEFSIMIGSNELMNSRLSGSEEALASLSAAQLAGRAKPNVLIGGLGMGFTLRAALAEFGQDATITVAELVPAVVAWAQGPMQPVFGDCLDDPRAKIHEGDVGALILAGRKGFDAILLDVDNGPEGLTRESNDGLYTMRGLGAAFAALRPGGVLAVWSSGPNAAFTQRLAKAGFTVEEVKVKAHRGRSGAKHVIWIAVRPGA